MGSKYFTLAPARKKMATAIFEIINIFFVNLRRKGFSIYGQSVLMNEKLL
jgi:hypothetical protein